MFYKCNPALKTPWLQPCLQWRILLRKYPSKFSVAAVTNYEENLVSRALHFLFPNMLADMCLYMDYTNKIIRIVHGLYIDFSDFSFKFKASGDHKKKKKT